MFTPDSNEPESQEPESGKSETEKPVRRYVLVRRRSQVGVQGADGALEPSDEFWDEAWDEPLDDSEETEETERRKRLSPRRRLIHVLLVVAVAWSTVMGIRNAIDTSPPTEGLAPDFTLETFDGERIHLADLRGHGVVLNFWASWCGPCRVEAPILEAAARREAMNGVVFVGINYQDSRNEALAYMAEFDKTYVNGPDLHSEIARRYGVRGIPDTIFIDPRGEIQGRILGPVPHGAALEEQLRRIRPSLAPMAGTRR